MALSELAGGDGPADVGPSFFDRAAKLLHEQGVAVYQCLDLLPLNLQDGDLTDRVRASG